MRAYSNKSRQLAVCTCLHTKGDDIHFGFKKPKKNPAEAESAGVPVPSLSKR